MFHGNKGGKAGLFKWVAASTWHKVPGRLEGGAPKRKGGEAVGDCLHHCCPSLYLSEKACPHAAGLGRVDKLAKKLLITGPTQFSCLS